MGVPPVPLLLNPAGAVIAVGVVSFFVLKEVNRRARAEARAREKTRRAKAEARRAEAEQDSSSDSDQETHYESDDSDEDEDSESGGSQTDASDDADEALESLLKQWARYLVNRVVHIATTLLRKMALAMLNGRAVLRVNKESGTLNQRRRCKAERRFFDPRRNRNQQSLLELLRKIIETRSKRNGNLQFSLSGVSGTWVWLSPLRGLSFFLRKGLLLFGMFLVLMRRTHFTA
ncbi:hypothetical protein ONE63_001089 [Megalurothrips usitatus]|uniref:Transmembrane protein n=1 Tax=Megalurothrips usitatus TaxID=439358 RepID=A0AAV7XC09_9NEOP|nr:hypothetical protein ONE63_001089 [Megalurothrips usitatus]